MATDIIHNQATQAGSAVTVISVANADKIVHWYDPYWSPVWEFLPWQQLATIAGLIWIGYLAYANISEKRKNKLK